MQVTVSAGELAAALKIVKPAISSKSYTPVIQNVLLEASGDTLTLTGTNLGDLTLRTSIPADISTPGSTTTSEARLASWIDLQGGKAEVGMRADDKGLTLSVGRNRARLGIIPAEDFPPFATVDTDAITLPADRLIRGIELTLPSVSKDFIDNVKSGLMLHFIGDRLKMAGLDGYRLGVIEIPLDGALSEPVSLLVPRLSIVALNALLGAGGDVLIATNEPNTLASFVVGPTTLITRILSGVYPDYNRVIPVECAASCAVPSAELTSQIRAAMLADDEKRVNFTIEAGGLKVQARASGPFEEHEGYVDGETSGTVTFCLNGAYTLDAIKALGSSRVVITTDGPGKPVVLTAPEGRETGLQLVMTMHVNAAKARAA